MAIKELLKVAIGGLQMFEGTNGDKLHVCKGKGNGQSQVYERFNVGDLDE
jgi:hypothetical protein